MTERQRDGGGGGRDDTSKSVFILVIKYKDLIIEYLGPLSEEEKSFSKRATRTKTI